MRICGLGWRADIALRDGGSEMRVLAVLSASVYVEVANELLWIGTPDATPHARAIHVAEAAAHAGRMKPGDRLRLPRANGVRPWRPDAAPSTAASVAAMRAGAARLGALAASELGAPRGFGAWLLGLPLAFPLDGAGARADALAAACVADDPVTAAAAANALVGLGPGLTPAGDDFTGGAFFARALLARAGAVDAAAWEDAASVVRTAAARLTHPIGAALLSDLLAGEGWAPMHDLAAALASDDRPTVLESACRLTRLGHSSGWDLLAGFVAGARA
jgi:hypothetical protein